MNCNSLQFLKKSWPLIVAPALFLFFHTVFSEARGPFHLAVNYDPDYAYLFNGLNLVSGIAPEHIDHPGTTLQLFAAAYIKLVNLSSSSHAAAVSVVHHSESYLRALNAVLMIGYSIALFLFGALVWRKTGNLTSALVLQSAPFLAADDFIETVRFRPEALLLIVVLIIAALLYIHVWREEKESVGAICLLSFLAATGAVTKLNFLPLALLPLFCLRTWKSRAGFIAGLCIFAGLWLLPLRSHSKIFTNWVVGLVTHQEHYGLGEPGLFSARFPTFLAHVMIARPLFLLTIVLSLAALGYGWLRRRGKSSPQEIRLLKSLSGLVLVEAMTCVMVSKYGYPRYLFPAMILCSLNAAVLVTLIRQWHNPTFTLSRVNALCLTVGILISCLSGVKLHQVHVQLAQSRDDHTAMAAALDKDFADKTVVYSYGCSSLYPALWFGNAYCGRRYGPIITNMFPNRPPTYFVEDRINQTASYPVAGEDVPIVHRLKQGEVLFIASQKWPQNREQEFFVFLPPNVSIRAVLARGDEAIYRVESSFANAPQK